MIAFTGTSLQLQPITTSHKQWVTETRSVPYRTTSVFSSTATNDERRITAHSHESSQSQSHIATDGQPASLSWNKAPIWSLRPDLYYLGDSYGLVLVGRPLWREVGSVLFMCCWPLPAQSFSGSESLGTWDHLLLSHIWDFPFCRLLRLAGSRWRYSILPPHGYW
jgi:hypothetical protein